MKTVKMLDADILTSPDFCRATEASVEKSALREWSASL